jgi:excisionase family DNA binding protein
MSEYVTAAEAAELLGVSDTHVRRHIQAGTVNAKKVKGRWSIARGDLEGLDLTGPPNERQDEWQTNERQGGRQGERTTAQTNDRTNAKRTDDRWRDDLLAQVARLEADKVAADGRTREVREEMGLLIEASKARVIDLERAATMRESRIADMESSHDTVVATHASEVSDLRGQVAVLEAKVRETLEAHTEKLGDLASDIAELANAKAKMEVRVYELEPVAEQVPMLQAAVDEKDATLTGIQHDIEALASRPVAGPVFRLLTKGKLRV